jgi:hypothetical protein
MFEATMEFVCLTVPPERRGPDQGEARRRPACLLSCQTVRSQRRYLYELPDHRQRAWPRPQSLRNHARWLFERQARTIGALANSVSTTRPRRHHSVVGEAEPAPAEAFLCWECSRRLARQSLQRRDARVLVAPCQRFRQKTRVGVQCVQDARRGECDMAPLGLVLCTLGAPYA